VSPPDPSVSRDDAVRLLLAGDITPEDYAQRVVPLPQRLLRTSRVAHALLISRVLTTATAASVAAGLVLAAASARQPNHLLLEMLLGAFALITLFDLVAPLVNQRLRPKREPREIDQLYRERYYATFRKQLSADLRELPENQLPDSEFIQAVVHDLQRALTHVGVPNAQVCILRSDGQRDVVSYYAGNEEPQIHQGTIVYDFVRVASRQVVCSVECSLGLAGQMHRIAVVARCVEIAATDEKLVSETAQMLSDACERRQDHALAG
jgi:hypothetical protein